MLTVTDSNNAMKWLAKGLFMALAFILCMPPICTADLPADIPGCATSDKKPYYGSFNRNDFQWISADVDDTTHRIKLLTGDTALDPTNIEIRIPIEQSVGVTFIYENAGFSKTIIGWMLKSEVVDINGDFIGWSNVSSSKKHPIYTNIQDSVYPGGSRDGGDGILDDNANPRVQIGGGTLGVGANKTFIPGLINWVSKDWNLDGVIDMRDSRVVLGPISDYKFPAGSEIVFYLDSSLNTVLNFKNQKGNDFPTLALCNSSGQTPCCALPNAGGIFFSKADWNTDEFGLTPSASFTLGHPSTCTKKYCSTTNSVIKDFNKTFYLGVYAGYSDCGPSQWLDANAVNRLKLAPLYLDFGSTQKQIHIKQLQTKFPQVMVGAPSNKPNEWVLGWEDWATGGDYDMNDVVIRVDRQTVGTAQVLPNKAIPASTDGTAFFTSVTIEVTDSLPCPVTLPTPPTLPTPKTTIDYFVSIDNGVSWLKAPTTTWDKVKTPDKNGTDVSNWSPGYPVQTYRSCTVDFAANAMIGDKLIWKAVMNSTDVTCVPEIIDVTLTYVTATNGLVSRASPSVQTNMIYSGSYETPPYPAPWVLAVNATLRGHLFGRRLYDPADPSQQAIDTNSLWNWDAGEKLTTMEPSARKIYLSNVTSALKVTDEIIAISSGTTSHFTGTFSHHPVSANTITINGGIETFTDEGVNILEGDKGGTGTINRSTGAYDITFNDSFDTDGITMPLINTPIYATYTYYTTTPEMKLFTSDNVTIAMLGLGNDLIHFDKAPPFGGSLTEADGAWLINWIRGYKDGVSTKKDWLLGAIDHSVPAAQTPPPRPSWYLGTKSLVASAKAKGQVTAAIQEEEQRLVSFDKFLLERYQRPTVIYVGARDGMLHAFDGGAFRWGYYYQSTPEYTDEFIWGDNPDTTSTEYRGYFKLDGSGIRKNYGTGEELWAYIPGNLVSRLKNNYLSGNDQAFVDASPTVSDVEMKVNGVMTWKTILLSAEGNGGDSVFCLDVTDTEQPPIFLWEFADPDLFRSRSSPSVSVIGQTIHNGERKWVAFFVSGKTNANIFPSVYMIDIEDGSVLERIFLNSEPNGINGIPSGQPAIVDSDGNGYIDRIYIGTDKGYLYKITIPDDPSKISTYGITNCVINTNIGSVTHRNPIYASPAVVVQNTYDDLGAIKDYKIKIFFGTSDSPYIDNENLTGPYHFFAYVDTQKKTDTCGAASLDWQYQLPTGERVFASAFAAAGTVYFGTATSETEDPCAGSGAANVAKNAGNLYAMTITQIGSPTPKFTMKTGNILTSPVVDDQNLYVKTPYGMLTTNKPFNNPGVGPVETSAASWREIFGKDETMP